MLKRRMAPAVLAAALVGTVLAASARAEPRTNLLHQWYRGSDAAAIAKLGELYGQNGGTWAQTPIAGHTANTIAKLRADVLSGNAPPAVQLKGPEIAEWAATGRTADLNALAAEEGWDKVVAPELIGVMKPAGTWVAAPMNIHRINWMWGSKKAMDKVGVSAMPRTWDEFNAVAEKMKAAGIYPVGHSSQDWIDGTLLEIVVFGMDIDLYRKAFVEMDLDALGGEGMTRAFDQLRKMVQWTDPGMAGREWDGVLPLFSKGETGFIFQGDWAIGTYNESGLKEGADYLCAPAPSASTQPGFILNSDSVIFFKQQQQDLIDGQRLLAHLIMSPQFQTIFNQAKGSIPARLDVDLSAGFTGCQQRSQKDLQASIADGQLVLSMAHNMAVAQKYRGAMLEVITEFVNTPDMASADAAKRLAEAIETQL